MLPFINTVTHRGRRGARIARREEGTSGAPTVRSVHGGVQYREYLTDEQRRGAGCIGGRMPTNFGDPTQALRDRIRTPQGKSVYVRALFARIADRYDFITVALSYGQDRRWKERLVDYASDLGGARALDLATGTGDVAFALAKRGAHVVGLDITPRMIELARAKSNGRTRFLVGDMCALPFADQEVMDVRSRLQESLRISGESGDGVGALGIDYPHRNTTGTETSDYSQADKITAEDDRPWIHTRASRDRPVFLGRSSTSVCGLWLDSERNPDFVKFA